MTQNTQHHIGEKRQKKRPQSCPKKEKLMDVLVFFADAHEESLGWIP